MTSEIIRVENLGKKYILSHQGRQAYTALRDVIAEKARRLGHKLTHPFRADMFFSDSAHEEFWALKDVSFRINRGDRVGIIGRNGAGKSTLLKVLSRITEPTTGRVHIRGRVASLLEVGTGFHPELTGRENIYLNGAVLGMARREIRRKFNEIVAFAEVERFLDTPVKHYSSGMYVRLAFAVAAHLEPDILIVDEVLAVGDAQFQKKCLGRMEDVSTKEGRTVLFVSHNMSMIENLCNYSIFMREGAAEGPMDIGKGIALYLGQSAGSSKTFTKKPLKTASIQQKGNVLEIFVEYELDKEIRLPCLGFVISDYIGNPICGSNPAIDPPSKIPEPSRKGTVTVTIENPKLLNGAYRVSLWFGDGKEDFFSERDCLTFDVMNMIANRQLPSGAVGPVFPKCLWEFNRL